MAAENELHLTCRKCSTVYRLDPARLGVGSMVRCSACREEWYQGAPENGVLPEPQDAAPVPVIIPEDSVLPPSVTPPEWDQDPSDDLTFRPATKGEFFLEDDMRVLPDAVMPEAPTAKSPGKVPAGVITHRPMGMNAQPFGAAVFALLFCVTLSALLLGRNAIVSKYPPMLSLYKAIGVGVDAPGQGLQFSVMTAENHIEKDTHSFAIAVKLANISEHDAPYPSYRVAVRDAGGTILKKWDFVPDKKKIASGETVPIAMTFRDAPDDAKSAEIIVTAD